MNYSYKVSCQKQNLKKIRGFVTDVLEKYSIEEVQVNTIVLAIDEVCANLIIHSHNCDPNESIEINISANNNDYVFDIVEHGKGFDISKYDEPSLRTVIEAKKKGGIGLILVKKIMDQIQFISKNGQSICRLTKHIESQAK